MKIRALALILLAMYLSGCATTSGEKNTQIQYLQNRINQLESELQEKDQKISGLENELDKFEKGQPINIYREEDKAVAQLSIKQIQKALKNAGFYKGPIDGKAGRKTREAIKGFQKAKGLKADGLVGTKTSKELSQYLNPSR